ncbi:MAG TPA: hypothetical protein VHC69_00510 [Polyangiaceae bacterium]|nr:hypothetical protein [Polyangiaceae bacterium]
MKNDGGTAFSAGNAGSTASASSGGTASGAGTSTQLVAGGNGGASGASGGARSGPGSNGGSPRGAKTNDAGASDHDSGHIGDADGGPGGDAGDDTTPLACSAGRADCNRDRTDGCEEELATSLTNCGTCDRACSTAGTTGVACVDGVCAPKCDAKHADCDGNRDNGCETDLTTDANSCGACGHYCSNDNAVATACVAGVCKPTCAAGYADCTKPASGKADDGCESSLTAETSCGACGHDCQGGACQAGQCQPVAVATGLGSPMYLAVAGNVPYVVDIDEQVQLARVDAGSVVSVAVFADSLPSALVSDAENVYLAMPSAAAAGNPPDGGILRFKVGESVHTSLMSKINPYALAVDGKNFYWSDNANGSVYQEAIGSNDSPIQLSALSAASLVSDGTTLYGVDGTGRNLYSVPVGGGAVTQITSLGTSMSCSSLSVGLDAKHVYAWFSSTSDSLSHLEQLAKSGFGSPREVAVSATVLSLVAPIATDANYVYFRMNGGLYRAPSSSGAPTLIANMTGRLTGLTVANGVLYWLDQGASDSDGSLYRLVL